MENFDLQTYMTKGVERVVADALRAALRDPQEAAFLLRFAAASRHADKRRAALEAEGLHTPPFLIASITTRCNLNCAGCYSRANGATCDTEPVAMLTAEDWGKLFDEAQSLGISFILLAGGEPMLRWDVMQEAAKRRDILFPIFTNGTFLTDRFLTLFDENRNLVPVLSIEGNQAVTDSRRGAGVYQRLLTGMDSLHQRNILFGASITVTTENLDEVLSDGFLDDLARRGCKLVVYVEFVPVTEEATELAPGDREREILLHRVEALRSAREDMVFISFPGDEKSSGGCVAAGRGFFHINAHGGAEPCPFSPFSDVNARDDGLRAALASPLFRALQEGGHLLEDHAGGCVLYEKRDLVRALVEKGRSEA